MPADGPRVSAARRKVPATPMMLGEAAARGRGGAPRDLPRLCRANRAAAAGRPRTRAVLARHFLRRSRQQVRWMRLQHGTALCARGEPQQEMELQRQPPGWNSSDGQSPHIAAARGGAYGR